MLRNCTATLNCTKYFLHYIYKKITNAGSKVGEQIHVKAPDIKSFYNYVYSFLIFSIRSLMLK